MPGVATNASRVDAPVYNPGKPTITASQTFATIGTNSILVAGDVVQDHTESVTPYDAHAGAIMQTTQTFFTINGIAVVLVGDRASCDSTHIAELHTSGTPPLDTAFVTVTPS